MDEHPSSVSPRAQRAAATADYLEMPFGLVQAAVAYYGAFPQEMDQWIELNELQTAEAYSAVVPGGTGHYGMVVMPGGYRRSKKDTGRIVEALEVMLKRYPGEDDLANGEDWL